MTKDILRVNKTAYINKIYNRIFIKWLNVLLCLEFSCMCPLSLSLIYQRTIEPSIPRTIPPPNLHTWSHQLHRPAVLQPSLHIQSLSDRQCIWNSPPTMTHFCYISSSWVQILLVFLRSGFHHSAVLALVFSHISFFWFSVGILRILFYFIFIFLSVLVFNIPNFLRWRQKK